MSLFDRAGGRRERRRASWIALPVLALLGCAGPPPQAHAAPEAPADVAVRWVGPDTVPLVLERDECAQSFAALGAVLAFWGRRSVVRPGGGALEPHAAVLAGDLERWVRAAGLSAVSFHGTLEDVVFELEAGRPVIVGVAQREGVSRAPHYEVVVGWDPVGRRLRSLDPARGFVERTSAGFQDEWQLARRLTLVVFESELATEMLSSSG